MKGLFSIAALVLLTAMPLGCTTSPSLVPIRGSASPKPSFVLAEWAERPEQLPPGVSGTDYAAVFREIGLGSGESVVYELRGQFAVTYGCVDVRDLRPIGSVETETTWPSTTATLRANSDGGVSGTLVLRLSPAKALSCPSGSEVGASEARYTHLELADTTSNVIVQLRDAGFIV